MSESNTAVTRPLPLWPYSASDHVNRARNSQPEKMAVNLNMQFVRLRVALCHRSARWRSRSAAWQNLAHGGALTFEVNGTLDLQDRQALEAVKPIFRWAAANQQYFAGQTEARRACSCWANLRTRAHLQRRVLSRAFSAAERRAYPFRGFRTIWTGWVSAITMW